jgi:tripartite-type tricarboxylate transporter receptor subunit TctC
MRLLWRLTATTSAAVLAGMLAGAAQAQATPWPARTVRVIAAGPAGGSPDAIGRLLADGLQKELKRAVIVDAKPGGSGSIAAQELFNAPRDGHTVLVAVNSLVSEIPHVVKLSVDLPRSLVPVAELARGGLVLVSTPALPAPNLAELIAYAKARPGQLSYASHSPGTMSHILGFQLARAAGIEWTHIGYKGSTQALADVMGGHVPLMFDGLPTSLPLIRSNKIRALAISTPKRSTLLPDVPTFTELGYRELEVVPWIGLWVAPDVPPAVRAELRQATLRVMGQPAMRERLRDIGFEPAEPRSPEEMQRALRADHERVGALLRSIDFKPQ